MICGVHALLGAALGNSLKSKKQAFLAGLISHFFADLTPHRDLTPATEALFAITATAAVGAGKGWDSPAFHGALGGVVPDIENAVSYLLGGDGPHIFPTHMGLHGRKVDELLSEIGLSLICIAALLAE